MVTFEGAFDPPEINRWLGGFLGAHPAGLRLQCLAFRASSSLAGGSDRMRLHCLRCLWRWERWGRHPDMKVLARRDGPLGEGPLLWSPSWLRTNSQTPSMSRALATWLLLDCIFHRGMADSGRWRPCVGRPLATVREGLVGTVDGSGTFSATRVASWTRHVAIACAKDIAKTNAYSPIYLLTCLFACLRACLLACLPP